MTRTSGLESVFRLREGSARMPAMSTRGGDYQDNSRPIAGFMAEYPSGFVDSMHTHGRAQLLYVAAGFVHVATDSACFVMPANRAAWLPPGVGHEVRCRGAVSAGVLYVDASVRDDLPGECRIFDVSALLRALILEAAMLPPHYDPHGRDGRIVGLILDEIATATIAPLRVPMPRNPRMLKLCRSILADPTQQLTLDDCARIIGMGRRTFTRIFRKETSTTFAAWRQNVRLIEGFARMAVGASVANAAVDVGYSSPSAFAGRFRRAFGVPPTQYLSRQV